MPTAPRLHDGEDPHTALPRLDLLQIAVRRPSELSERRQLHEVLMGELRDRPSLEGRVGSRGLGEGEKHGAEDDGEYAHDGVRGGLLVDRGDGWER